MEYEEITIGKKKYKILKINLNAINKVVERLSRRREPSTVQRYKEHLLDFFGIVNSDVPYTKITFDHIDKFWRWKHEENEKRKKQKLGRGVGRVTEKFSKQYINLITSILTTFFIINNRSNFAEKIREQERQTVYWKPKKLDTTIVQKLRNEETVREGYRLRGLTDEKIDEFYIKRDALLIELLACTGIRISEAQNLKRDDVKINVKNPYIVVTKAKRGFTRKVRVSKRFIKLYKEFMSLRRDNHASVFTNKSGNALSIDTLKTLFRQATAALSKPDKFGRRLTFGPHMLRHAYATFCVDLYPLRVCRYNLGHVNVGTTGKYLDETEELLTYDSPLDKINGTKKLKSNKE